MSFLLTDEEFIEDLKKDPRYSHVNIDKELGVMRKWYESRGMDLYRSSILKWLDRKEIPVKKEIIKKMEACFKCSDGLVFASKEGATFAFRCPCGGGNYSDAFPIWDENMMNVGYVLPKPEIASPEAIERLKRGGFEFRGLPEAVDRRDKLKEQARRLEEEMAQAVPVKEI